ncbi:RHS repeat domain-containing protein [Paraburkholderia sp. 22099]|uniref:RHS repeat domain-containing protein n=1 Tax=Paraburkholderia sp. 22099 TaxID=3453875 RepID=UPI003F869BBC
MFAFRFWTTVREWVEDGWTRCRRWRTGHGLLVGAATSAHADEIIYGYDALGRLTSVALAGDTAYYDYDAAGNITAIRRQAAVSSAAGDASSLSSNADAAVSTFAKTD